MSQPSTRTRPSMIGRVRSVSLHAMVMGRFTSTPPRLSSAAASLGLRQAFHRINDLHVARAPADIGHQRLLDLRARWHGLLVEVSLGEHDYAGCAKAALDGTVLHESLLDRVHRPLGRQAFDRGDLRVLSRERQNEAGAHRSAVYQDRTGSTFTGIAPPFGANQSQLVAQDFDQEVAGL